MGDSALTLEQALEVFTRARADTLAGVPVLVISSSGGLSLPPALVAAKVSQLPASDALTQLAQATRFELGVVAGALGGLSPTQARGLLAALRDRLCTTTWVVERADSAWGRSELLSLAFTQRGESPCGSWRLYDHDIASYNPERDWNNPDHWANPENFDRYRW